MRSVHHQAEDGQLNRREIFHRGSLVVATAIMSPKIAHGVESQPEQSKGLLTTEQVAELLHPVPTFTIVDKKGVPYMVVGEDAKVTGYFFTTFGEASRILELAKSSADKAIKEAKAEGKSKEEVGTNPWKNARISSIPLDSAITLVSKSTASFGGGNYFKIAPSEEDVEDALKVTGKEDLAEGLTPLFYYEDFAFEIDGRNRTPLYFRKSELESDFKRENPGSEDLPKIMVTELLSVLAELVKPNGSTDEDLKNLIIMAPKESIKKKKECDKAGGKEAPFYIGQRIIIL